MTRGPAGPRVTPRPAARTRAVVASSAGREVRVSTASIVVFAQHGAAALRETLHALRETAGHPYEVVVLASDCDEQLAIYLNREYFRRNIAGYVLDHTAADLAPCRVDRAFHLTAGDYLVRLDDALSFTPGWLATVVAELDADAGIGWLSLLEPPPERRPRGRPRKPTGRPESVEHADWRCYATRRALLTRHERGCRGDADGSCLVQQSLAPVGQADRPSARPRCRAPRSRASRSRRSSTPKTTCRSTKGRRARCTACGNSSSSGDAVLMTCMACGCNELEVLAARVKFCAAHHVAIGHLYEFRCPECNELHYRDVLQFRCPDAS